MSSIERRIEQAEKAVHIGGKPAIIPGIIYCTHQGSTNTVPHFPEPVSEWVTVRQARDQAERTELPYIVEATCVTRPKGLEPSDQRQSFLPVGDN